MYLGFVVLLPLAALVWRSTREGRHGFWAAVSAPESLGAGRMTVFRRIVLPNLVPAILSGVALAYARAIGEFGSVVLITGNLPFKTEVSSVYIYGQIQSGAPGTAAAVSVLLLAISLAVLLLIGAVRRWAWRHGA